METKTTTTSMATMVVVSNSMEDPLTETKTTTPATTTMTEERKANNKRRRIQFDASKEQEKTMSFTEQEMVRFPTCAAILNCEDGSTDAVWNSIDMSYEQVMEALTLLRVLETSGKIVFTSVLLMPVLRLSQWLNDTRYEAILKKMANNIQTIVMGNMLQCISGRSKYECPDDDEWRCDRIAVYNRLMAMNGDVLGIINPKGNACARETLCRLFRRDPHLICEFLARTGVDKLDFSLDFVTYDRMTKDPRATLLQTYPHFKPSSELVWRITTFPDAIAILDGTGMVEQLKKSFAGDTLVVAYKPNLFMMMDGKTGAYMYAVVVKGEPTYDASVFGVVSIKRDTMYMNHFDGTPIYERTDMRYFILGHLQRGISLVLVFQPKHGSSHRIKLSAKKFNAFVDETDTEYYLLRRLPDRLPLPSVSMDVLARLLAVPPKAILGLQDVTKDTKQWTLPEPGMNEFYSFLYECTEREKRERQPFCTWIEE